MVGSASGDVSERTEFASSNFGRLVTGLLVLGVLLRVFSWAAGSPLWTDEILLGRNVIEHSIRQLMTQPLELDQVAPTGFLFVTKTLSLLFGTGERVLRIVPLAAGIGLVLLARPLARNLKLDRTAAVVCTFLLCVAVPFVRFSSELKQYSSDAFATMALLVVFLGITRQVSSRRQLLLAGAFGFVMAWLSQASVIVMAALGMATVIEWLRTRDDNLKGVLLVTMPLWGTAAALTVLGSKLLMTPETSEFMQDFWRGGFWPRPFALQTSWDWLWTRLTGFYSDPFLMRMRFGGFFGVLAIIGFGWLWRRNRLGALAVAMPLLLAVVAALLQQFPFQNRVAFYLLPLAAILLACGIAAVASLTRKVHSVLPAAVAVLCLVPTVEALVKLPPPYNGDYHADVLAHIQQQRQPGDRVVAMPLPSVGMAYYGAAFGIPVDSFAVVRCNRDEGRPFVREVDQFRGNRIWFISSMARPYRTIVPDLRRYLSTIGTHADSLAFPSAQVGTVYLDLFDLRDTARWSRADAETFDVQPLPRNPRPGCRPWQMSGFRFRPRA